MGSWPVLRIKLEVLWLSAQSLSEDAFITLDSDFVVDITYYAVSKSSRALIECVILLCSSGSTDRSLLPYRVR